MKFQTKINGLERTLECEPDATLFEVLRANGFQSVRQGCDREGLCGACTVLLDGRAILSCITPAPKAAGHEITTVEALGTPEKPHALQKAFVEAGAVQCGYCTPGMLLASKALLDENPNPSDEQIADALSGNLCRCTGYVKITEAVKDAAKALALPLPLGAGRGEGGAT
ncbi:MAG TPA: (2Fe-2S)-binding protein [Myxococcales bacterium]|jgi:aerobic-type carbon monoxide dehydrogenase small subunit (CoxS/CutS family)